jgi:2-keto-4-pentenoate hydratase
MRLAPCVEIADCRFAGWALPPGGAPADFGLQGSMVFGPVVEPVAEVHVEVRRDGETVGAGEGTWAEAAARLSLLPASLAPGALVATGSITAMFPAARGRWEFDFGPAGTLVLDLA